MQNQLHPGAKWQFRIQGWFSGIFLAIFLSFFLGGFILVPLFLIMDFSVLLIGFTLFVFWIIIVVIFAEIYSRMAYARWFYEFTPTNLKIERGIIWKKYSNIPYERVQNVDIQRGILARMLGFSTVNIQTAGYSFTRRGMPSSEGYLPAVSVEAAEKIREFLMKKISKNLGGQGL